MDEHGGGLMNITGRHRRWAAPIVALVAVAALVGLLPHLGFSGGSKAPLWTDKSSHAENVQMQMPDWVRLSKEATPAVQHRIAGRSSAQRASRRALVRGFLQTFLR
jgi:hypothetical protein